MTGQEYIVATQAAQGVLKAGSPALVVDGKWGKYTNGVYAQASPAVRASVDAVLRALKTSAAELFAYRENERAQGRVAVDVSDIRGVVTAAAAEAGVPASTALGFAKIESNFNPKAVNGSSRGLMQMQPAAWSDAKGINPSLKDYSFVFDPMENARAGMAYIKYNMRQVSRLGGPQTLTPAQLYLAHQQGAGGFTELWNVANGRNRPLGTKGWLVTEKAMRGNPPQDGRGVTVDRKEFYDRWIAVAERKMTS